MELFECIRYYYMTHEDLLALMSNKTFSAAKKLIGTGLSLKLNDYAKEVSATDHDACKFLEPRVNYEPAPDAVSGNDQTSGGGNQSTI